MAGWEKEDYTIAPPGTLPRSRTGPVTVVAWATGGSSCNYQGFQVTADAIVSLDLAAGWAGVGFGAGSVTVSFRQNGTIVGPTYTDSGHDMGIASIHADGIHAVAGDIFTIGVLPVDYPLFAFGVASYVWEQTHFYIYVP
jgi:hypothetical protein